MRILLPESRLVLLQHPFSVGFRYVSAFLSLSSPALLLRRHRSATAADDDDDDARRFRPAHHFGITMAEVLKDGVTNQKSHSLEDLLKTLKRENITLPPRDLKIFFRSNIEAANSTSVMTRPRAKCFLLELEHLKIVCLSDKCFVLHPEVRTVSEFVNDLSQICATVPASSSSSNGKELLSKELNKKSNLKLPAQEFHKLLTSDIQRIDFEHVVLEQALSNITSRFSRHVWLTKPALELLLQQISQDPSGSMLRRLLAFRKSLGEFESNVQQVHRVLDSLLKNDEDLVSLYLTKPDRQLNDHSEVELLIEAYSHDLSDIISEIKQMKDMVEETNQFINTHLDTVRNRMIRMSLFMEMGTLSLASGAVIAGVFGMNLLHGMEESSTAFYLTSGAMMAIMLAVFGGVASKYTRLVADTTRAHSFKSLKNFFHYVDELDRIIETRGNESFSKSEFKEILERVTGTHVTAEEFEFFFKMFDADKDGKLEKSEIKLSNVNVVGKKN